MCRIGEAFMRSKIWKYLIKCKATAQIPRNENAIADILATSALRYDDRIFMVSVGRILTIVKIVLLKNQFVILFHGLNFVSFMHLSEICGILLRPFVPKKNICILCCISPWTADKLKLNRMSRLNIQLVMCDLSGNENSGIYAAKNKIREVRKKNLR